MIATHFPVVLQEEEKNNTQHTFRRVLNKVLCMVWFSFRQLVRKLLAHLIREA